MSIPLFSIPNLTRSPLDYNAVTLKCLLYSIYSKRNIVQYKIIHFPFHIHWEQKVPIGEIHKKKSLQLTNVFWLYKMASNVLSLVECRTNVAHHQFILWVGLIRIDINLFLQNRGRLWILQASRIWIQQKNRRLWIQHDSGRLGLQQNSSSLYLKCNSAASGA